MHNQIIQLLLRLARTCSFWRKFAKYFLVGISVFVFLFSLVLNYSTILKKGPEIISAQEESYGSAGEEAPYIPSEEVSQPQPEPISYQGDGSDTSGMAGEETSYQSVEENPQPQPGPTTNYNGDGSQTSGYSGSESVYNPPVNTSDYNSDFSQTYGSAGAETAYQPPQTASYNSDGTETYGYAGSETPYQPQSDGTQTYGYAGSETPYQPPAPVTYPQQPPVYQPQPPYQPPAQVTQQPQPMAPQPQQVAQPEVTPVTVEDYRCEGNDKVFYRVFININRSPERTGRVERNSPTCISQFQPVVQPQSMPAGSFSISSAQAGNVVINTQAPETRQQFPSLSASCAASPNPARIGESVTWRALTNGGSGSFNYRWFGDSSVNGQTGNTIFVSYSSAGTKTVQLQVIDSGNNNNSVTAICSIQVLASQITATTPTTTVVSTPQVAQCPSGTIEKSRTSAEVICERQLSQSQIETQAKSAPTTSLPQQSLKVLGEQSTTIKELPKTGLPLAVVGFSALTPLGLRLKRLMGTKEVAESANELWMKRQFSI